MSKQISKLLEEYLYFFNAVKTPIKLVGIHGIGKTELLVEYANYIGFKCLNVRAAHFSDVDINGYPVPKDGVLTWLPPDWLQTACSEPCVLFLDEINRGKETVRNCLLQLTDSRRINEHVLHPNTRIFSAVNPDTEKYYVNPYDSAELDRWFVIDFAPKPSLWLSWAKANNVHPSIINFIASFPESLDPKKTDEPGAKGPSRRSWKRLSDAMIVQAPPVDKLGLALAQGFVGKTVGNDFWKFYKNNKNQQEPLEVLEKIRAENLTIQELGTCINMGNEFWTMIYNAQLLGPFLYSVSRMENIDAFNMLRNAIFNISDPILFKKVVGHSYNRGNRQTTFADDVKHEESVLRMRLGL